MNQTTPLLLELNDVAEDKMIIVDKVILIDRYVITNSNIYMFGQRYFLESVHHCSVKHMAVPSIQIHAHIFIYHANIFFNSQMIGSIQTTV